MRSRNAFTLVELLVVAAIISVLIALLLPAVQAARAAGLRTQCENQIRQIGLGIANYHSAFNRLPRATWLDTPAEGKSFNGAPWGVTILPFIEQQGIHEQYDHQRLAVDQISPKNVALCGQVIATYVCPSTPEPTGQRLYTLDARPAGMPFTATNLAPIDYCPTSGVRGLYARHAYGASVPDPRDGVLQSVGKTFGKSGDLSYAGIEDGLSQTTLLGERSGGSVIYSGGRLSEPATAALIGTDGGGWGDVFNGEHWLQGSLMGGIGWPPQPGPCAIDCTDARTYGFAGFHVGGCYFLFADSSVRFVSSSVDAKAFASSITRRLREFNQHGL